jgi:hypothetical protein
MRQVVERREQGGSGKPRCDDANSSQKKMVGAVRFELTDNNAKEPIESGLSASCVSALAQLDTQPSVPVCPELARVVVAWARLPEHVRKTIVMLTDTR